MASFLKTIICISFLRPSLLPTQTTRSSALAPITRMISLRATRLPASQLDATLMSIKMASMSMASRTAVKKMMKEAGLTILKKYLNSNREYCKYVASISVLEDRVQVEADVANAA